ncbi:mucin-binding protein [Lactobacillus jensenii]|uniref:mucin-binding protein n=1 Tax=Lactobacillus jensenii TaxID=109790 RepID=UPI001CD2E06B|nr:MucBP domain-containing protein [Lactobacillus jensenii]
MRVSKNNIKNKLSQSATRTQHFSIRKLSIGAASVLLSTSLYFGLSGHASVFADTSTAQSTSETSSSSSATQNGSSGSSSSSTTQSESLESSSSDASLTSKSSSSTTDETSTDSVQSSNNVDTNSISSVSNTNSVNAISSDSNSINLAENGKITLSKTTIGNDGTTGSNRSIIGHLNLATVHIGDVYKITIPKSSTYSSTGVTAPASSTNFSVETSTDENNWYITVKALNDSSHADIRFVINAESSNYTDTGLVKDKDGLLTDVGTKTYNIVVTGTDVNGNDLGSVSSPNYQAIVKPQFNDITYTSNSGIKDNVAVANRELSYTINVHEAVGLADNTSYLTGKVAKRVNHGSIITIPMPKGFVLNVADTQAANESGVTFSQDSDGNVIINASKATGDLAYNSSAGYVIKGSYNIDTPENDTTLTANGPITVKQIIDDNGTTITGTGTSVITQVIVGKNSDYDGKITFSWSKEVELYPYGYSYSTKKILDGKYNNAVLAQYTATNNSLTRDVTNPTITVNVPDGLAVTSFNISDKSTTSVGTKTYTIYYEDGTSETGTATDDSQVGNGKTIKQIIVKAETLPSLSSISITTWGNTAETYRDGTKTGAGFTLKDSASFTGNGVNETDGSVIYNIDPLSELKAKASFGGLSRGNDNRSDFYQVYFANGSGKIANIKDPVFYYVLPTGVYFNGTITNLQGNPTITTDTVNGHQIVKVDYTGTNTSYKLDTGNGIGNMNLGVNGDASNGTYTVEGFIKSPETVLDNDSASKASDVSADYFGGSVDNVYYIGQATFPVTAISSLSPVALISGNKDHGFLSGKGSSDDKGSTAMQIGFNIINNESTIADGDVMYLNIPSNGLFKVTGPVVAPSGLTGYTIYYSKSATDLNNAKVTDLDNSSVWTSDTSNWTAEDWAQVKSVAVSLPNIAGNTNTGRFIINGEDPTIAQDAGKTLAVASAIANPNSKTIVVSESSNSAPKLTISGTSTIKTALKYTDADGQTHTINLNYTKQYQDNSSTMNYSDFPSTINGFNSEDQAIINALIAKGYKFVPLSDTNNTILNNGGQTWKTDINTAPDGSATWGGQVKYYFDGDTVVYTLAHQEIPVTPNGGKNSSDKIPNESGKNYPNGVTNKDLTKTVTRTINIHNIDGTTTTITQDVKFKKTAYVDAVTGKITGYSDYTSFDDNNGQYAERTFTTPAGYSSNVTYKNTNTTDTTSGKVTTESATDKDGNPVDETVDVKFIAQDQNITIKYVDDDNNGSQVGDNQTVKGKTDETVKPEYTIPDGYDYVSGKVDSHTMIAGDNTVITVHLKHHHDLTTKTINKEITYQTTLGKQVADSYKTSTTITKDYDEATKTTTYKVNGEKATTADLGSQDVPAAPTGYHLDTDQSIGDYNKTTSYDLVSQFDTLTDGQTVNAKVIYAPDTENVKVRYETADGKTLAAPETKSGDYGSSYETNAKTITGYHLTKTPTNATGKFGTTNDDVVYTYAPDTENVKVRYETADGKTLADSETKSGDYGSSYETSAKTITGYHLIKMPSNATGTFSTTNDDVVYTYAPDKQQINIVVIDSSTGEKVNVPIPNDIATTSFTGNSNETIPTDVKTNVEKIKDYLKSKGYTVPDTITIPSTFDDTSNGTSETDASPQIVTIEVGHHHTTTDKTITKTITYKTDKGDSVADNFTKTVTIHKDTDDVTGTSTYTANGTTLENGQTILGSQSLPSKTGYYAAIVSEGATSNSTVSFDSSDITENVVYKQLGKIIPVDEKGNPIKGADTPTYNNSNNPTKPGDTTTPTVPGYTTTKTTVNGNDITDPSKDTPVTYTANKKTTNIVFKDQDNNNEVVKTVPVNGHTSETVTVDGTKTTIPNGYELVDKDGNVIPTTITFTGGDSTTPDTVVYVKHKHDITTKTINKEITYQTTDGKQVAAPYKTFTTITQDYDEATNTTTYKVNGKTVTTADLASQKVPAAPTGYHLDTTQSTGDYNKTTSYDLASQFSTLIDGQTVNAKVVYTPDKQTITVTVHDSETNTDVTIPTTIPTSFDGTTGGTVDITDGINKIKTYLTEHGYTVPDKIDIPTNFDNTDNGDSTTDKTPQLVTITVGHKTTTVTPDKPKTTNDNLPDNPDKKYPSGVSETELNKTITRTIVEVDPVTKESKTVATQTVHYTRTATVDEVTGKVTYTDWTTTDKWASYTATTKPGYTPSQKSVDESTPAVDDKDQTVTITYTANPTNTNVVFVDDNENGKTVKSVPVNGVTGGTTPLSNDNQKIPDGYELVDGNKVPTEIKFNNDGSQTPDTTIHLKHKTTTVTPDTDTTKTLPDNPKKNYPTTEALTKTVTRTINVHNTDGTVTTKTATVDEVTGEVTNYGDWTVDTSDHKPSEFEAYNYTTPSGYTSKVAYNTTEDKAQAGNGTVAKADASTTTDGKTTPVEGGTVDVYFVPEKQTITVTVTDQDRKPVVIPTDIPTIFNGTTNSKVGTDVTDGVTNINTYLKNHGYEVTNQSETPKNFDDTDNTGKDSDQTPQNISITVKHKTVDVTPDKPKTTTDNLPDNPDKKYPSGVTETDLNKTITRTIVEVDPVTKESKTVATQPVHYTRTATVDEVTGKVTYTDWTTTDKWASYTATTKPGYTPSQKSVDESTPSVDDKDQTVTITYTANPTNTNVVFVDDNENGKTVKSVSVNGVTGGTTPLSNDDQKIPDGYELVDGNKVPTEIAFNNSSQTPDTTIHLKHKIVTVTPDKPTKTGDKLPDNPNQTYPDGIDTTKTVTRTINVHKPDGTTKTTTQTVTFTRTVTVDEVTGKVVKTTDWTSTNPDYPEYTVPTIDGYTPSQTTVEKVTPKATDKNSTVDVTYTGNIQTIKVVVIDKTTGKEVTIDVPTTFKGTSDNKTDKNITDGVEKIKDFLKKKGYSVPDKIDIPTSFDHSQNQDSKTDDHPQVIKITVDHTYSSSTQSKTITRTIKVVTPDGKITETKQTVTYTRTVTTDNVTGESTKSNWATTDKWSSFTTPTVDGYTPSQAKVDSKTPTADDKDETITITYIKDADKKKNNNNSSKLTHNTTPINEKSYSKSSSNRYQAAKLRNTNRLPQTGNNNEVETAAGLAAVTVSSLMALLATKKKKRH